MSPQPAGVPWHLWQHPRLRGTICSGSRGCGHRVQPPAAPGCSRGLGAPAARAQPGSSASSRGCGQQPAVLCPAAATHGSAARGRSWSWHGHCGDAAGGLGGLGALGLLSLAHDSSALAPIFSGCDATSCSPREKLFLRAALARRLPRWGWSSRSWRPAGFSGGRSLVTASRAARENNSTSVRMLIHSTGSERWE